jgi:hypothetical protein
VILRLTPYDYPAGDPSKESLGISQERKGFSLQTDPNGLTLIRWYPQVTTATGSYLYQGTKLDEPIIFEFSKDVDPASLSGPDATNALSIRKIGSTTPVAGWFDVNGKVVTFYPQAQEVPARSDVLTPNTGYAVSVWPYDPSDRTHAIIKKLGADPSDTNDRMLLIGSIVPQAFLTAAGSLPTQLYMTDTTKPSFTSRVTPSGSTEVSTGSGIQVEFDDRLLPTSLNSKGMAVIAKAIAGVDTVVYGTVSLKNLVDRPAR